MPKCDCGADEVCLHHCDKHDQDLHGYPCFPCQEEWALSHPHTSIAITKIAEGKNANLAAARKKDEELSRD